MPSECALPKLPPPPPPPMLWNTTLYYNSLTAIELCIWFPKLLSIDMRPPSRPAPTGRLVQGLKGGSSNSCYKDKKTLHAI